MTKDATNKSMLESLHGQLGLGFITVMVMDRLHCFGCSCPPTHQRDARIGASKARRLQVLRQKARFTLHHHRDPQSISLLEAIASRLEAMAIRMVYNFIGHIALRLSKLKQSRNMKIPRTLKVSND